MKRNIKQILIIANYLKKEVKSVVEEMKLYFINMNIKINIFGYNEKIPSSVFSKTDLTISLGGDGTLLYTARMLSDSKIPILGVNLGDFGFITEVSRHEWKTAFEKYISHNLKLSERIMVNTKVERNGTIISELSGLNDAVISSSGISRLIQLKVFLSDTYVGRYRADGIIIATPTGSTAYSMAAEGPILHPEMEAFILNPICPFTLSNRPIVVPGTEIINVKVEKQQKTDIILTVDGQEFIPLKPEDKIVINSATNKSFIINSDKRNFYEVLRSKLNWSGEPNA